MKKGILSVFTVLALLFIVACGENEDNVSQDSNSDNVEKEEVLLWHHYTGSADLLNEFIADFNGSQDEIVVRSEYVPFSEMNRQLSVGTAGGTLPDMILADTVNNVSMAAMGTLADITDRIEEWGEGDVFLNGPMKSGVYEGSNYGLPLTTNSLGLFYNKKLFEEAGITEPPTTLEELEAAAAELTTDDVKGFGLSAVKSEEATFQFYPFIYSSGGDYRNMDSPEVVDTFNFIKGLLEQGYMSKDVLTATQDDLTRMFIEEDLAMMINGPWMIDRITENEHMDFGITQIPMDEQFASVTGGDNVSLTKDGNIDAAWEFMKWLLSPENNEEFALGTGYYPTRSDVLQEAEYWKNEELVKEFIPIMEVAEPRGPSANWPKVSEAIQIAIQEVLTDSKATDEALSDAAAKIEEAEAEAEEE